MRAVREALGNPRRVVAPSWIYGAPLRGRVSFVSRHVDDVWTRSRRQRTKRGIGPGSTLRAVKRAYPKVRCHSRAGRWDALCALSSRTNRGHIDTNFLFDGRRVAVVDVFRVRQPKENGPF